tara:strand:- start:2047 stop:2658 length:612 start_codon:yes stop_codon:yes gene_type:complete
MEFIEKVSIKNKIPSDVYLQILEYSKPSQIESKLRKEIEKEGTYALFNSILNESNKDWETYYIQWNSFQKKEIELTSDEYHYPNVFEFFIEKYFENDKKSIEFYLDNIKLIYEDKKFLERKSGIVIDKWVYNSKTRIYTKEKEKVTIKIIEKYIERCISCLEFIKYNIEFSENYYDDNETLELSDEFNDYGNDYYDESLCSIL